MRNKLGFVMLCGLCAAAGFGQSANFSVWPLCWLSVPGETNICAGGM